ncbi:MAG: FecR family protein [Daejeonella sp.]|uniref:FecR family protein n=1 Tax=Daejeonella sp. TaxID=2805397 RepID=UPI003C746257
MDQLQRDHFLKIIEKYHAGNASREELAFLDAYYQAFDLRDEFTGGLSAEDRLLLKSELESSIQKNIHFPQPRNNAVDQRKIVNWSVSFAAAVLLVIGVGLFYLPEKRIAKPIVKSQPKDEIIPGGDKAVITLANGKQIILTDAKNGILAEHSGIRIVKTTDGELVFTILDDNEHGTFRLNQNNTIETPNGGSYRLRLPDGSNVWLNAASKLTFPSSFMSQNSRTVELEGEAYFEIAKDKVHPFIVKTHSQIVEVFGTQFNINSYVDEPEVKTTLLEGSIKVIKNKGTGKFLKPGQQSILTSKGLMVENVDTELAVAWKGNRFVFESVDIQYIMRMLARWYNVEVEYVGEIPKNKFGGALSRFENISEVLKSLESTGRVKFVIKGRRILVSK